MICDAAPLTRSDLRQYAGHFEPTSEIYGRLARTRRTAHGFSPTANLAVKGITKPPNPEFKNARKPGPTHGFLAKSNTCSRQITPADQSLPNSSRATPKQTADLLIALTGMIADIPEVD